MKTVKQEHNPVIEIEENGSDSVLIRHFDDNDWLNLTVVEKSSALDFIKKFEEVAGIRASGLTKVYFPEDVDEFKEIINTHKPFVVWHEQWSSKMPFVFITGYTSDGFRFICNGNSDKTPDWSNPVLFHGWLKHQGLTSCYIEVAPGSQEKSE